MTNKYIQIIFLHLQGIVLFPTLKAIYNSHLCKTILSKTHFTIKDLEENTQLNIGYLNIALRTLRSCNLLDSRISSNQDIQNEYIATNELINLYKIYKQELRNLNHDYYIVKRENSSATIISKMLIQNSYI